MGIDYDEWLQKPYQDMYDKEDTRHFSCAESNELDPDGEQEDGLPYCDFEGDVDCYVEEERSRHHWEITYTGECPQCGRKLIDREGDERQDYEY